MGAKCACPEADLHNLPCVCRICRKDELCLQSSNRVRCSRHSIIASSRCSGCNFKTIRRYCILVDSSTYRPRPSDFGRFPLRVIPLVIPFRSHPPTLHNVVRLRSSSIATSQCNAVPSHVGPLVLLHLVRRQFSIIDAYRINSSVVGVICAARRSFSENCSRVIR